MMTSLAVAEEDKLSKDTVSDETIKNMADLPEKKNAAECWEFVVDKLNDKEEKAIVLFEEYRDLAHCAWPHVKTLINKTKQLKDINEICAIAKSIAEPIDEYKSVEKKIDQLCTSRTSSITATSPDLKKIKSEFYQALKSKKADTASVVLEKCMDLGFDTICFGLEEILDQAISKWTDEKNKREEQQEQRRLSKKAADLHRENVANMKYAISAAKEAVIEQLHSPSSVRWVSFKQLVEFGKVYGFHAVYEAQNRYGVYLRSASCLLVFAAYDEDLGRVGSEVIEHDNTENCSRNPNEARKFIRGMLDNLAEELKKYKESSQ
jgi:quinol monooxygenase YgiN